MKVKAHVPEQYLLHRVFDMSIYPITIILEDENEAHTLWHWLNADYDQSGEAYAKESGLPKRDPKTITRLFWMLNKALGKTRPW
jgi:hypothetical protein